MLRQIVPNLSSLYTHFYSVIYNSVVLLKVDPQQDVSYYRLTPSKMCPTKG